MKILRWILYPLALLYGFVVAIRNSLFNMGILKTQVISMPSIGVGNLSSGGTGKSVVIDYLIVFLKEKYHVAVLSRGYKRKTSGVVVGNENSSVSMIGDEPLQFLKKHQSVTVVVAKKRILGIQKIKEITPSNTFVLLDDVMQHRYVKPSILILTTTFSAPYFSDQLLPTGNLRESQSGAKRANIILVTKCPDIISKEEEESFKKQFTLSKNQFLFLTKISYSSFVFNGEKRQLLSELTPPFLLITGIADPSPLVEFLNKKGVKYSHLEYPDHHAFTKRNIKEIYKKKGQGIVFTTEKDFNRLKPLMEGSELYYLPIKMTFIHPKQQTLFEALILNQAL
ncbi:MAG: tetraacyldisaccharide 4'-kinase [Flavobacteriaceae bacterium]|jgi:tetraacyldisaccharide 4'-kinase|tara:strand:+ start:25 stop:1041 length:1017 start_codon:yes stop_codon:yes gene_type:complete